MRKKVFALFFWIKELIFHGIFFALFFWINEFIFHEKKMFFALVNSLIKKTEQNFFFLMKN